MAVAVSGSGNTHNHAGDACAGGNGGAAGSKFQGSR